MSSKTKVSAPAPTPEERELQRLQVELAKDQISALDRQQQFQEMLFELVEPGLEAQKLQEAARRSVVSPEQEAELYRQQFERELRLGPIQDEILQAELERIRRGGAASPEQKALIDQATEAAITSGERDISTFRDEQLQALREELSPALGFRPGDSPLVDRGGQIANRSAELQQDLVTQMRGAQAQAMLNFPLAADQLASSQANFQLERARAVDEFRTRLRESAAQARMQSAGMAGSLNLGVASQATSTIGQGVASGQQFRAQTASQSYSPGFIDYLNAGAGIAQGVGSAVAAFGSSRSIKSRTGEVDSRDVLDAVRTLEVARWQYRGDSREHIGPYAEDFRDAFGVGDGKTIHIIDAIGVLMASVKALADRLEMKEAAQ